MKLIFARTLGILIYCLEALVKLLLSIKYRLETPSKIHPQVSLEERKADEKQAQKLSPEHRKYFGKNYELQCSPSIFSDEEHKNIIRYGSWLSALAFKKINPETSAQAEFVGMYEEIKTLSFKEMHNYYLSKSNEIDDLRALWFKYLCRIKYEKENPDFVQNKSETDWGWHGPPIHSGLHVFFSK